MRDVVVSAALSPTDEAGAGSGAPREAVRVRTSKTPGVRLSFTVRTADGQKDHRASAELSDEPTDGLAVVSAIKTMQRLAMTGPWAATAAGVGVEIDRAAEADPGDARGADAACALIACNHVWELGLSDGQIAALAASLGEPVAAALGGTRIEKNEAR